MSSAENSKPRFANTNDGSGTWYRQRGRWTYWYDLSEWLLGVQVTRGSQSEYGHVCIRIGPLWIDREFGA